MNNEEIIYKKKSQISVIWKRFKKSKVAMIGLFMVVAIIMIALFADFISDYQTSVIEQNYKIRLQPPSKEHWFGTDAYGRDIFARILHGTRISLTIGLITTFASASIGIFLGSIAAYFGKAIDGIIMRILDTLITIPEILLALAIIASIGPGIVNIVIAMTIWRIPGFARIIRSSVLGVVDQEYIEAARACGSSDIRIITKHVLPNAIGPIIVQATMSVGKIIIVSAALSFLGMGIQPPAPEWGSMLAEGREYMRNFPYIVAFPGIAIVLTALSLNLLGDGLRDALDPRLKN